MFIADEAQAARRPNTHTFALKTYRTPEAAEYFENERDAFRRLRSSDEPPANIIEYYGIFVRGGTYNLILQFADQGTLEDYIANHPEPQSISDITTFSGRLLDVMRGPGQIHGTKAPAWDGPHILLGYLDSLYSIIRRGFHQALVGITRLIHPTYGLLVGVRTQSMTAISRSQTWVWGTLSDMFPRCAMLQTVTDIAQRLTVDGEFYFMPHDEANN